MIISSHLPNWYNQWGLTPALSFILLRSRSAISSCTIHPRMLYYLPDGSEKLGAMVTLNDRRD